MADSVDSSNAVIHPPIAWALAFVAGLGLDWLYPTPFVPAFLPAVWLGKRHLRPRFWARHFSNRGDP